MMSYGWYLFAHSEMNILAMRIGKGKHLKGRTLMGGIITPEEFDHFYEVTVSSRHGGTSLIF